MKSFIQFITESEVTDNPNFRIWFGDSKIVDEQGNPLVVYHGTDKVFDVFDTKAGHDRKSKQQLDFGSHFSNDSEYTKGYSKTGKNASYYLSIKNPYDAVNSFKWKGDPQFEECVALFKALRLREFPDMYSDKNGEKQRDIQCVAVNLFSLDSKSPAKVRQALINAGFDGVIYEPYNIVGVVGAGARAMKHPKSFVAFYPTQIKSTENDGSFNPSDPNVYH